MGNKSPVQLFFEFKRGGRRTYAEACELLKSWGFTGRQTPRGHSVWTHPRRLTLTLPTERELKTYCRQKIISVVGQLLRPSDPPTL